MKKKRNLLFWGIALIAIISGLYLLLREPSQETVYSTVPVERGNIIQTVSATGTLQAVNTVEVGTQVSGTIEEIFVDYNSPVKKGQVIAKIDSTLFHTEVKKAEADLASARASVEEAQAELVEAAKNANRQKTLYASDFVAESEVDAALTTLSTAQARLASSKASVLQAEAALEKARTNLGYTTIVSPVDGVVIAKDVSAGQTVAASLQTPTLFTIAEDLSLMQVEADVDEADIGYVKEGAHVSFYVDAYPEETFTGKVRQVRLQPVKTENVVTYTVVIDVSNPQLLLKPGMTANVSIQAATALSVLKVPSMALRFVPESDNAKWNQADALNNTRGAAVWVLSGQDGKTPQRIPVRTGISDGSFTEVEGELEEGMRVIVSSSSPGSTSRSNRRPGPF
jgi:HlyD family secretion protein